MKLAVAALLSLTVSAPALAAGQLPRTVVPVLYDITVRPNPTAMTFSGAETVTVDVREPTRELVLNAAELEVTSATFNGRSARFRLDAAAQTLTVTLPQEAKAGRHSVAFQWTGKINQSAVGFFAIDYANAAGSPARMLATQFEAPDARRFAPMWDEPSFKARFRLASTAPAGQTAYSNMPATSVVRQADGSQLYRFGESPLMSSYLLFLGMGEVERRTAKAEGVEVGVITRRGVVDQGEYALGAARRLLAYYNDYFGQPYPLPKLDMIAGPGSSQFFGAMENWGAIFYFEPTLLFDPTRTAESARQNVHRVVAHEIAHQWFGNLVTMAWWDDLWLNEGFASWIEGRATGVLNPTWETRAGLVAFQRETAMQLDATAATHPIIRRIETVDQISEAFDSITYSKGQAIIGMLESTVGERAFRDGVRRYMARYKYGNTVTNQLWAEISAASGRDIAKIANDFTLQGGVPLVTMTGARCSGGSTTVTLTQGRFGLDQPSKAAQTWNVPLAVSTLGGGRVDATVTGAAASPVRVKGCGAVVLNQGKGSYTRVMYDDAGHAALVRAYPRLALEDRVGTLGDDFALAAGGYQDLSRYFAVQDRISAASDPLEWSVVTSKLSTLTELYDGTSQEQPLRARTNALLSPVLVRIGFEAQAGESPLVSNLREALVGRLGANGDPAVASRARAYVAQLGTNPTAIPPAIRQPILSSYATNAIQAEWDQLLELAKAERSPVAKNRFVQLLGFARDEAVARRSLELLRTDTFTTPQKASLLRSISAQHPDLAFSWAVQNEALVNGFIEQNSRAGYIVGLGGASNDPAMTGKINAYVARNEAARSAAQRTVALIDVRKTVADRLRSATARWLGR